ncbi:MAG: hypothetical protein WD768_05195, partial [Phycisphaeraceae bacterium]
MTQSTPQPHAWLRTFVGSQPIADLLSELTAQGHVLAEGAWGSSTTLVAGALAARSQRPVLLVVAHLDDADDAIGDLELFEAAGFTIRPQRFGALEVLPGESAVSLELLAERLAVVESLATNAQDNPPSAIRHPPSVLVASVQALMQAVPEPDTLGEFCLTLETGKTLPPGALLDWLDRAGYKRTDAIEHPGDFATRGGIIDVFAPSGLAGGAASSGPAGDGPAAIRLDYFGDDIDSIGLIDLDSLGSSRKLQRFQLIGASAEKLQSDERTTNLVTLLPRDTIVILAEAMELAEQARGYFERLTDPRGIYGPQAVFKHLTQRPFIQIDQYSSSARGSKSSLFRLPARTLAAFDNDASKAIKEIAELTNAPAGGGGG